MQPHHRKRNRKHGFDYASDNIYFVTICTQDRIEYFGNIRGGEMVMNTYGHIVNNRIQWLETQYPYVRIHNHVVMPNHVHVLFEINTVVVVGAGLDLSNKNPQNDRKIHSVSALMGALKTTSSKEIHQRGCVEFRWQRSFHDHIVRNAQRYENIDRYISENPARWDDDGMRP